MTASSRSLLSAAASVLLVSAAQVGMRWSMMRLPDVWSLQVASMGRDAVTPALILLAAVAAYGASFACWLVALRHLALNRAYPILATSYALVYLASALLPGLQGSFSVRKSVGVVLVLLGVALINARRRPSPE